MRKHFNRGPSARELRRAAWRGAVRQVMADTGFDRRLANYALQVDGGSWRTFGLPYELGGPVLGPPAPPTPWAKDGIPFGVRCLVFKDGVCKAAKASDGRANF